MAGSNRIILQPRDESILSALRTLRILDREAVKLVVGFKSTTRANARLLALSRAGILRRLFYGTVGGGRRALYFLPTDRQLIRLAKRYESGMLGGDGFLAHQLALNDVHLALRFNPGIEHHPRVLTWQTFQEVISPSIPLIPDAYMEVAKGDETRSLFVELDRGTETFRIWSRKIELYLEFARSGEFEQHFGRDRFRVLVVATSEARMRGLHRFIGKATQKLFWISNLDVIKRDGFFSPVWLRPGSENMLSLM